MSDAIRVLNDFRSSTPRRVLALRRPSALFFSIKTMSRQDFTERRSVIHRFARAGIKFEPALIRSFSVAFGCSPTSIYNDLRTLEAETGRLLVNPSNSPESLKFPRMLTPVSRPLRIWRFRGHLGRYHIL